MKMKRWIVVAVIRGLVGAAVIGLMPEAFDEPMAVAAGAYIIGRMTPEVVR